jgi:alpha-beta hydrolase superfamily lysophospholipase
LYPVQKLLVAVLPSLFPNLRVGNGLDARLISHDPAVVTAYQTDPLVHDRIAARLARFIADDSASVRAAAPGWTLPTLLL